MGIAVGRLVRSELTGEARPVDPQLCLRFSGKDGPMSPGRSPSFASALGTRGRHTMTDVLAKGKSPRAVQLSRVSGWAGLAAFTIFLLVGLVTRLRGDAGPA